MRKHKLPRHDFGTLNRLRFERKPFSYILKDNLAKADEELKLAAVMLYWGEGAKNGHTVDFVNSDVNACVLFIRFLRFICGVTEERLRCYLYCHANQNPDALIKFWSKTLQLRANQFTKPYIKKPELNRLTKKHPERMMYGVVHIRYSDIKLLQQINQWIKQYNQIFGQVPK